MNSSNVLHVHNIIMTFTRKMLHFWSSNNNYYRLNRIAVFYIQCVYRYDEVTIQSH